MDEFENSPRPHKKPRNLRTAQPRSTADAPKPKRGRPRKDQAKRNAAEDEELAAAPSRRKGKQSICKTRSASVSSGNAGTKSSSRTSRASPEKRKPSRITTSSESEDAFERPAQVESRQHVIRNVSSSDEETRPKSRKKSSPKAKRKSFEPSGRAILIDRFVSQVPPDSSDPHSLRGPIWIQPSKPVPSITRPTESFLGRPQQTSTRKSPLGDRSSNMALPARLPNPGNPLKAPEDQKAELPIELQSGRCVQALAPPDTERSNEPMPPRKMTAADSDTRPSRNSKPTSEVQGTRCLTTSTSSVSELAKQNTPSAPESPFVVRERIVAVEDELADLPSDAFSSSPEAPTREPIRKAIPPAQRPSTNGLSTGYRQMTLEGAISRPKDAQQVRSKRPAQSALQKEEKPTHHKLNEQAMSTWVYPTNLGVVRDYQYNIVQNGLFHNLLVALPTGLGKTFIAATIMLNWYRWTQDAQILFVAPTKPLVAQQIEACFHTVGIPRSDTAMLTGEVSKAVREIAYENRRVFFMTPQTVQNDLSSGIFDPKRVVLLVVDEAHKATGNYAYVKIVELLRRFNQSFRVLALTATPGAKVEAVQQVIDGLDIARTEIRTEESLDIRPYVFSRETETFLFDFSQEQEMIMELFSKALQPTIDKLRSQNATWLSNARKITPFGLTNAQRDWQKSEAGRGANQAVKGMIFSCFTVLSNLAQAMIMLKYHGTGPFFRKVASFAKAVDGGEEKKKVAKEIRQSESFIKMYNYVSTWIKSPDFIGHPKLEYLRTVILNHFLDAGETGIKDNPSGTRVMVFSQYRDSAEEIARVLKRNEPMIRPRVFVGQSHAEGSAGMGQKEQIEAVQLFKSGTYNVLVATSIGEEGLDIGEVDMIICFDASSSPIRMLQRMGRTGRKRQGKITLLLMKEKEETDFAKSKDNYEKMQGLIASGDQFKYHEDRSPRILPKGVKPEVDKRVVEIPTENSQADLPIPTKRTAKKKPKKFHMPDGVITGFVKASRVRGHGSDVSISGSETERPLPKSKKQSKGKRVQARAMPTPPEPDAVPIPFLNDVLLNTIQERELSRKYQNVNTTSESAVIQAPAAENNLDGFRHPGPIASVQHSTWTASVARMLAVMHEIDAVSIERSKATEHDIDPNEVIEDLYADPALDHEPEQQSLLSSDSDSEASPARPPPKKRGRPAKPKAPAAPKVPNPRKPAAPTTARKKAAPRGRQGLQRNSSAIMEAASSSPPPTPPDMALPSQGIALGSADTSGEDEAAASREEDDDDSELEGFVVGSDEEIEFVSSSLPHIPGDSSAPQRPRKTTTTTTTKKLGPRGAGKGKVIRAAKSAAVTSSETVKRKPGQRGVVSEEFVVESDDGRDAASGGGDGDGESGSESDDDPVDLLAAKGGGFDPGLNEGISAGQGRAVGKRRRVVESDSDE